jgi:hypothetical protein
LTSAGIRSPFAAFLPPQEGARELEEYDSDFKDMPLLGVSRRFAAVDSHGLFIEHRYTKNNIRLGDAR